MASPNVPVADDYPAQSQGSKGGCRKHYWRSHQVPFAEMASANSHVLLLEEWMKSYKPEEAFNEA